jgi:hypothetical protein
MVPPKRVRVQRIRDAIPVRIPGAGVPHPVPVGVGAVVRHPGTGVAGVRNPVAVPVQIARVPWAAIHRVGNPVTIRIRSRGAGTCIPHAIAVSIHLGWIHHPWAVVDQVHQAVAVRVGPSEYGVTCVSDRVAIDVELGRVGAVRAVVGRVGDPIPIPIRLCARTGNPFDPPVGMPRADIADIPCAIVVRVRLGRVERVHAVVPAVVHPVPVRILDPFGAGPSDRGA